MGNSGLNLKLSKFSIGTGDRFAHQAKRQLQACVQALRNGVEVIPVWNKSNREHTIIGSEPSFGALRRRCSGAGAALGEAVLLRRRPHHAADRRPLPFVLRFLHHRRGRLHRPAGAGNRH